MVLEIARQQLLHLVLVVFCSYPVIEHLQAELLKLLFDKVDMYE
jgi:hypothetical protein